MTYEFDTLNSVDDNSNIYSHWVVNTPPLYPNDEVTYTFTGNFLYGKKYIVTADSLDGTFGDTKETIDDYDNPSNNHFIFTYDYKSPEKNESSNEVTNSKNSITFDLKGIVGGNATNNTTTNNSNNSRNYTSVQSSSANVSNKGLVKNRIDKK